MQYEAPSFDRYLEPKSPFRFCFEVHYVDCSRTVQLHQRVVMVLQYMPFKSIAISGVIVLMFNMGVCNECCHFAFEGEENKLIVTIQSLQSDLWLLLILLLTLKSELFCYSCFSVLKCFPMCDHNTDFVIFSRKLRSFHEGEIKITLLK